MLVECMNNKVIDKKKNAKAVILIYLLGVIVFFSFLGLFYILSIIYERWLLL